jgi:hypothetical protein
MAALISLTVYTLLYATIVLGAAGLFKLATVMFRLKV